MNGTTAVMWEVRARPEKLDELVAWIRDAVHSLGTADRVELFAGDDRAVVISLWSSEPVALPDPPEELVARPPHSWAFERMDV